MPSQRSHPDTSPVVHNVRSVADGHNQQMSQPSGRSPLPPAKRSISVPAGERDSSQGGSSVATSILGQNSTPSSSLNNSRIAVISQRVALTLSAIPRWSIDTLTATPGTSSCSTPAPGQTSRTDSTPRVVSSPASCIPSTPTPLSRLEHLPTLIPNPDAHAIITNLLQARATGRNQRQRQWQL